MQSQFLFQYLIYIFNLSYNKPQFKHHTSTSIRLVDVRDIVVLHNY